MKCLTSDHLPHDCEEVDLARAPLWGSSHSGYVTVPRRDLLTATTRLAPQSACRSVHDWLGGWISDLQVGRVPYTHADLSIFRI